MAAMTTRQLNRTLGTEYARAYRRVRWQRLAAKLTRR